MSPFWKVVRADITVGKPPYARLYKAEVIVAELLEEGKHFLSAGADHIHFEIKDSRIVFDRSNMPIFPVRPNESAEEARRKARALFTFEGSTAFMNAQEGRAYLGAENAINPGLVTQIEYHTEAPIPFSRISKER